MTKKELRAAMRRRNLGMDAAERAEASRRIFGRAGRLEAFGAARTVGVFCSLPDEPDTAETLARWSAVKRIVRGLSASPSRDPRRRRATRRRSTS
mgnify:CR=1 FL=1